MDPFSKSNVFIKVQIIIKNKNILSLKLENNSFKNIINYTIL